MSETAWQPIDSAPRDGSWFITANFAAAEPEYEIARYNPQMWCDYEEVEGGLYRKREAVISEWECSNFHRATNWTPIPPHNPTSGR